LNSVYQFDFFAMVSVHDEGARFLASTHLPVCQYMYCPQKPASAARASLARTLIVATKMTTTANGASSLDLSMVCSMGR
jgi:hypothetical protein